MSGYMRNVTLGAHPEDNNNGNANGKANGNGKDDVTIQALSIPALVPKLPEPTKQFDAATYISIHDYNLLVARANTRTMTNTAVGVGVGLFIGWALVRAYRR